MRVVTAKAVSASSIVIVALTVAGAWSPAPQRAATPPKKPSAQSMADVVVALVQSKQSGGVVITLPAHLEATLQREQARPGGFLSTQSPFGVWIGNELSGPDHIPNLAAGGDVDAAVATLAAQFGLQSARWRSSSTYLLRSVQAGACAAQLRAPLRTDVENRNLVDLVSAAIHDATGAKVPGGFVGSCIGETEYRAEPVRLRAGLSLEDALNTAVQTFGGAVWVAVQDAGARCSVGLVRSSQAKTACKTAITASLQPGTK